jgi:hypothetical protein
VEPNQPFAPPKNLGEPVQPLGSLAQSARGQQLKQARGILIFIGVLTIALNAFLLYNLPNEIAGAVRQNNLDATQVEELSRRIRSLGYLYYGGPLLLGVVFVALGLAVKRFPVLFTTLGLCLYIGSALVFAALDPMTLAPGFIVKILIVLALLKAIKAARAYEAEQKQAVEAGLAFE